MHQENVVYTYNEMLAVKKKEILPSATTQIDLEDIMLNEISQAQKNKYYNNLTYTRNLK